MAKVKGKSTVLAYCATVNGTFVPFADIIDANPPDVKVTKIDTTHMASAGGAKEQEPGWIKSGEATAKIHYVAADQITNRALIGVSKFWRVTYSDGSYHAFQGRVKRFGASVVRNGIVTTSIAVKASGKVSFTPAT